ncbi:MAG: hypothetical protein HRJ53_29490 [Acidobacteria bacterium Pan2503]|uniref:Uncharacterized protein n=1 Tax=Candidatus Acidiferrum panamense TaxID=2741543 RepID=A0A7V8T0F7_9BACT|nr:hypothetical protein [Candidatus Acidoferrum panamensis]
MKKKRLARREHAPKRKPPKRCTKMVQSRDRSATRVTPKQLIRMLEHLRKRTHCKHKPLDPHTCPYLEDVLEDKRTKCRCCEMCQLLCAEEI